MRIFSNRVFNETVEPDGVEILFPAGLIRKYAPQGRAPCVKSVVAGLTVERIKADFDKQLFVTVFQTLAFKLHSKFFDCLGVACNASRVDALNKPCFSLLCLLINCLIFRNCSPHGIRH